MLSKSEQIYTSWIEDNKNSNAHEAIHITYSPTTMQSCELLWITDINDEVYHTKIKLNTILQLYAYLFLLRLALEFHFQFKCKNCFQWTYILLQYQQPVNFCLLTLLNFNVLWHSIYFFSLTELFFVCISSHWGKKYLCNVA